MKRRELKKRKRKKGGYNGFIVHEDSNTLQGPEGTSNRGVGVEVGRYLRNGNAIWQSKVGILRRSKKEKRRGNEVYSP